MEKEMSKLIVEIEDIDRKIGEKMAIGESVEDLKLSRRETSRRLLNIIDSFSNIEDNILYRSDEWNLRGV